MDNPNPVLVAPKSTPSKCYASDEFSQSEALHPFDVYQMIADIRDPEHPHTLADLGIVDDENITVIHSPPSTVRINVTFTPTVGHCSLASLIGLCIREKIRRELVEPFKLQVCVAEGTHDSEEDINKQLNDKERVCAAMENEALMETVSALIEYQAV
jgi:metal-sulfur cluster biosynthetic enzyme